MSEEFDQKRLIEYLGLGSDNPKKTTPFRRNYQKKDRDIILKDCQRIWGSRGLEEISILDPFGGTGTTGMETLRLGCSVTLNDYNPVAWLIQNTILRFPRTLGTTYGQEMKKFFKSLSESLKQDLISLYPPVPKNHRIAAYIYAWRVLCPTCSRDVPLVQEWTVDSDRKKDRYIFVQPQITDNEIEYSIQEGSKSDVPEGNVTRGKGKCLFCHSTIDNKAIANYIRETKQETLLAIAYRRTDTKGVFYRVPTTEERKKIETFKLEDYSDIEELMKYIPTTPIPLIHSIHHSVPTWDELFTPRQILYLASITHHSHKLLSKIEGENRSELVKALCMGVACLQAKIIDFNCRSTRWQSLAGKIGTLTSFRKFSLIWNHTEVYPFGGGSGSLEKSIKCVIDGIEEVTEFLSHGLKGSQLTITNKSVLDLPEDIKHDIILTDPPYFDDVPYPEVAEAFYVWQQPLMEPYFAEENPNWLNSTPPRVEDLSSNNKDRSNDYVKIGLEQTFAKLGRVLKPNGILALYYAHSKVEAWEFVINGLAKAGFIITATYPMATENVESIMARGKSSIFSSILVVARKRKDDRTGVLEDLEGEIREKIYPRLDNFWRLGLRHADLTGAAIGPVLEVITSYKTLRSRTGRIEVTDILTMASENVVRFVLSKYFDQTDVDSSTAFYLYMVVEQLDAQDNKQSDLVVPFDTAHILSKSMNLDLSAIERDGLIDDGGHKQKSKRIVRILGHDMRTSLEGSSLIDGVHRAMRVFSSDGISGMQDQLKEDNLSSTKIRPVLELIARSPSAPGQDQSVARKMLGLRDQLQKGAKKLTDYLK